MKKRKPTNLEFAKKFDTVADKYIEISNDYTSTRRIKESLKFLKGRCLEVGGASGNLVKFIEDRSNYVLSDISPKMCEVARKKYNCKVVCCDAEKLPFKKNEFDSIICLEVIYYLDRPENFLREANRVLKPGGTLIISMFNNKVKYYHNLRTFLRRLKLFETYFDDPINTFISLKKLIKMLKSNNFKIVKDKKIILIPFGKFHKLNLLLEKTFLKVFSTFIIIVAKKDLKLDKK